MSNPLVEKLYKKIRPLAYAFLAEAKSLDAYIFCSFRTFQEQTALYAQGRTKPGEIVTKSKAGYSWHNYGCAFDVAFGGPGKWNWNGNYNAVGALAKKYGLEWGKDWNDKPHFQMIYRPKKLLESQWMGQLRNVYLKSNKILTVWDFIDKNGCFK